MRLLLTSVLCAALSIAALVAAAEPAAQRQRPKIPPKAQKPVQGKKKATPAASNAEKNNEALSDAEITKMAKQVISLYDEKKFAEAEQLLTTLEIERQLVLIGVKGDNMLLELMRTVSTIKASIESKKPLVADESGKVFPPAKDEDQYHLSLFLMNRKFPAKRTQFETEAEYKKRIPWLNPCTVHYMALTPYGKIATEKSTGSSFISGKKDVSFQYNIDKQFLTFFGGERPQQYHTLPDDPKPPVADNSVLVSHRIQDISDNISERQLFVLNVTNLDQCPADLYSQKDHAFTFSFQCAPKVAEKISRTGEIVIGFRFTDAKSFFSHLYTGNLNLSKLYPTQFDLADASIVRVLVRDRLTKKIFAEYHIDSEIPIY